MMRVRSQLACKVTSRTRERRTEPEGVAKWMMEDIDELAKHARDGYQLVDW